MEGKGQRGWVGDVEKVGRKWKKRMETKKMREQEGHYRDRGGRLYRRMGGGRKEEGQWE